MLGCVWRGRSVGFCSIGLRFTHGGLLLCLTEVCGGHQAVGRGSPVGQLADIGALLLPEGRRTRGSEGGRRGGEGVRNREGEVREGEGEARDREGEVREKEGWICICTMYTRQMLSIHGASLSVIWAVRCVSLVPDYRYKAGNESVQYRCALTRMNVENPRLCDNYLRHGTV